MVHSTDIKELATALSKAQGQIKVALKDSANPFFKSKYADLSSVWEACRGPLTENGLAIVQLPFDPAKESSVGLETTLLHNSGQFIVSRLVMPVPKFDPQGVGSAIKYARRYSLAAMVGVVDGEDDDGEGAMGRKKQEPVKQPVQPVVKIANDVKAKFYEQALACIESADEHGLREIWSEHDTDNKVVLWGLFNSQQRSTMKKMMGVNGG